MPKRKPLQQHVLGLVVGNGLKKEYHQVTQYQFCMFVSNDHLVTIIASFHPVVP
jgi:hypothetical protein